MDRKIGNFSPEMERYEETRHRKSFERELSENIFCGRTLSIIEILKKGDEQKDREREKNLLQSEWANLFIMDYDMEDASDPRISLLSLLFKNEDIVEKLYACNFFDQETYFTLIEAIDANNQETIRYEATLKRDVTLEGYLEDLDEEGEDVALQNVRNQIEDIPIEVLKEMTAFYTEYIKRRQAEVAEKVEDIRVIAIARIEEYLSQKQIELPDKKIQHLKRLRVDMVDPIMARYGNEAGRYSPREGIISVSLDLDEKQFYHTLIHEMMHALSGFVLLESPGKRIPSKHNYDNIKFGLGFQKKYSVDDGDEAGGRLSWLDEALVERMALESVQEEKGTYEENRQILDFLLTHVPEKYFIDAFFQDYDTDLPQVERLQSTRLLIQKVNEEFGEYFFQRLDKFVNAKGLYKTVEVLQSGEWENIFSK